MSRQPRFEEIEDDDDPPELELPDMDTNSSALLSPNDFPQPSSGGMPKSANDSFKPHMITQQDMEQFKRWSCIYPVYFDASRTLQEGRRVPLHMAVRNPLAKDLAEAAASLGIQSVLEVFLHSYASAESVAH
jgi:signal recognition particle subunit SRP19